MTEVDVPGVEDQADAPAESEPQRPGKPAMRAGPDDRPHAPDEDVDGGIDEQMRVEIAPLLQAPHRLLPAALLARGDDFIELRVSHGPSVARDAELVIRATPAKPSRETTDRRKRRCAATASPSVYGPPHR